LKSSSAVKEDVGKVRAEMKKLYVSLSGGGVECGVGSNQDPKRNHDGVVRFDSPLRSHFQPKRQLTVRTASTSRYSTCEHTSGESSRIYKRSSKRVSPSPTFYARSESS
jgi:hypothetical protein